MVKIVGCQNCKKTVVTELKHLGPLCRNCFLKVIEKRIRKNVRINEIFSPSDKVTAVGELNGFLIGKITKEMNVKVEKRKRKGYKVLDTWTVDDEACLALSEFLEKKKRTKRPLSIFSTCSDKELALMSNLLAKEFSPRKKDSHIAKMLETLEEEHAETKFSTAKSSRMLAKITKN